MRRGQATPGRWREKCFPGDGDSHPEVTDAGPFLLGVLIGELEKPEMLGVVLLHLAPYLPHARHVVGDDVVKRDDPRLIPNELKIAAATLLAVVAVDEYEVEIGRASCRERV